MSRKFDVVDLDDTESESESNTAIQRSTKRKRADVYNASSNTTDESDSDDLDDNTPGTYYPLRFESVIFFDRKKKCQTVVPLDNAVRCRETGRGVYMAAVGTKNKKIDSETRALRESERQRAEKERRFTAADVRRLLNDGVAHVLKSPEFVEGEPGYMQHSSEVPWNSEQVAVIEQISFRVPMIRSCVQTLKNLVMSDGVKFVRGNVELVPSRDFLGYTQQRLHPFAYQCIDALLMIGVIPIVYEMDEHTGQRWPYVPALGTYELRRYTVRGSVKYRFYWTDESAYRDSFRRRNLRIRDWEGPQWQGRYNNMYPGGSAYAQHTQGGVYDPSVEIVHSLGYDLTSKGELTSKLASLLTVVESRLRMIRSRAIADSNAAAPPLVTEYNLSAEQNHSRAFKEGYYTSAVTTPDDGMQSLASHTYMRDAAQRQAFGALMRHFEESTGMSAADRFGVRPEEYRTDGGGQSIVQPSATNADGLQASWANQYHLNPSRQLRALPAARAAGDFVAALGHMDDDVCGVLGVPKTYIHGSALRAGTELVSNRLSDEVRTLKKVISDVMTHVYNVLFLGEDVSHYMNSEYRSSRRARAAQLRRRRRYREARRRVDSSGKAVKSVYNQKQEAENSDDPVSALLDEQDLYVVDDIKRTRVTFAKKASETPDELMQMFALGAIDQPVLCAEFARRNNFDASQLCSMTADGKEKSEIPMEMRRFLIPQFADAIKFEFQRKQHEDQLKLQRAQMRQQQEMAEKSLKQQKEQARMQQQQQQQQTANASTADAGDAANTGGAQKQPASSGSSSKTTKTKKPTKTKTGAGGGGATASNASTPSSTTSSKRKKA